MYRDMSGIILPNLSLYLTTPSCLSIISDHCSYVCYSFKLEKGRYETSCCFS